MQLHIKKSRTGKMKKVVRKLKKEGILDAKFADDLLEDLDDIEEDVENMRIIAFNAVSELMRFKSRGNN